MTLPKYDRSLTRVLSRHEYRQIRDEVQQELESRVKNSRSFAERLVQATHEEQEQILQGDHEIDEVINWMISLQRLGLVGRYDPPRFAESLVGFLVQKPWREALLGDLVQHFKLDREKWGDSIARALFWIRVISSAGPLIGRMIERFTTKG
jgi:hypothetical protein